MLYNGSEVIRDLEWVIFDEVHYINDAEVRKDPDSLIYLISPLEVKSNCCSLFVERGGVGGGFDHAPRSRQHYSP